MKALWHFLCTGDEKQLMAEWHSKYCHFDHLRLFCNSCGMTSEEIQRRRG